MPKARRWEGPWLSVGEGSRFRTLIFYGPWQCRQEWLDGCRSKCLGEGHTSMGCIWVADIKQEWQGRFALLPAEAGTRIPIKHCCCDYPATADLGARRDAWKKGRDRFRQEWSKEAGDWPKDVTGTSWPGHHVFDLKHGGAATARDNVIPVPPDIHTDLNTEYPRCYSGQGRWNLAGPYWPYSE